MSVDYRGTRFDVDGGGVPVTISATLDGNVTTQITRDAMDRRITKVTQAKTRLTTQRDECQAELDAITTTETDLIALRATATADPA